MPLYLFKDGNVYKDINLNTINTDTGLSSSIFTSFGFQLNQVTDSKIRSLTNPEIVGYDTTSNDKTFTLNAIPNAKLILNNTDLPINLPSSIDSITIDTTLSGSAVIKIIVSNDSGATWKTYNNGWQTIDANNISTVASNGISPSAFNSISSADWNSLLLTNDKIRLGYYINIDSISDSALINSLSMQSDNKNYYQKTLKSEAVYQYFANKIKIYIYSSGTYKINY